MERAGIAWKSVLGGGLLALTTLLMLGVPVAAAGIANGASAPSVATASPSVSVGIAPATSEGNEWTEYMQNIQHTSNQYVPEDLNLTSAKHLTMLWNYSTGDDVVSEPTVLDNHIFFGSWNGYEYSLDANNGTFRWKTYTGASICAIGGHSTGVTSTAVLENGDVYFGGGGEYWEALSQANGSVLWQIYTGNNSSGMPGGGHYNWASAVPYKGYIYTGIASQCDNPLVQGQVIKINPKTEKVVARFNVTSLKNIGGGIWSSPAIDPTTGDLFVGTGNIGGVGPNTTYDDSIIELNSTTLKMISHFQVPYSQRVADGDFGASVTLFPSDTGTPLVADADKNGIFYVLDQNNLHAGPVWEYPIASTKTYSSAAYHGGTLYVGSATTNISGVPYTGSLRAFNATTGAILWQDGLPGQVFGPIVYVGGLLIAAPGHYLDVFKATTGKLLWSYDANDTFFGYPSVANGRIYEGNNNGYLYAFGLPLNATATASPRVGPAPLSVHFAVVPYGGAQSYRDRWSFGDGTFSSSPKPTHVYSVVGNYTATVTVTDQNGATYAISFTITVTTPPERRETES